ncbi:MAG TPA: NAD(P)-dependent oxidoreductase [Anaerolineales bacterium]|nr:NAD(P)-dependent oxidoreductase [Anaerolineales bacterium]
MKVLITGAGGFIGSHLVDSQLKQGNNVRALDLHLDLIQHQSANPHLETLQGDITDEDVLIRAVADIDVVYHLASAHLDVSLSDEHYRRVNVGGTLSLLEAARQAGVKRFVHCSSVGVIGDVENPPADETTDCHPTNIYERTKLEGEREVLAYSRRTGFPVVVMRPAWVYGPRDLRTAKLMRTISKGRFFFFGDGQNMRHPVYISDAVKALELCASAEDVISEVFIIGGEHAVPVSELVSVMSKELGVRSPKLHLPVVLGVVGSSAWVMVF